MTNEIRELIEAFDKDAQRWAWDRDWGCSDPETKAERDHTAKAALVAAIERLEKKAEAASGLLAVLEDLVSLAFSAMRQANNEGGGEYDINAELKDARAAIAKAKEPQP